MMNIGHFHNTLRDELEKQKATKYPMTFRSNFRRLASILGFGLGSTSCTITNQINKKKKNGLAFIPSNEAYYYCKSKLIISVNKREY